MLTFNEEGFDYFINRNINKNNKKDLKNNTDSSIELPLISLKNKSINKNNDDTIINNDDIYTSIRDR